MISRHSTHPDTYDRTLIIGDVHGCADELQDLLKLVQITPRDRLISVGDLICKGPDSLSVMQWALESENLQCVVGNHEARFLKWWNLGQIPREKSYDEETYRQLLPIYEPCMIAINKWPLLIEDDDFRVVHGGIDPRQESLDAQNPDELISLRKLSGIPTPWFELYTDPKPIIFGHWAQRTAVVRANAFGLDTGCVYGGALTALLLPEWRLIQIKARRPYRQKPGWPA